MNWKRLLIQIAILIILLIGVFYLLDNPEKKVLNKAERARLGGTFIKLSHGFTHYKLEGQGRGKMVVLVHGETVPMWNWDQLSKKLQGRGRRVLRYDMFGRGYSVRPDVTYDQELYRKQLLELVDKLGLKEPFDLVGYSLGGGTAVNFTATYPKRVRKLILVSPIINNFKPPIIFRTPAIGELSARLIGIRILVKQFKSLLGNNPDSEKYVKLFTEQTTYKGFQRSILSMLRNNAMGDYSKAYKMVGSQKRDVCLLWGTEDNEVTKEMIKEARSYIPHLNYKQVEGVGHGIVFQKPDFVNNFIVSCLDKR